MSDLELEKAKALALSAQLPDQEEEERQVVEGIANAPEATNLESFSAGVIEGVPFMKDAIAGYDAIKEAVTNDTEDSIQDIYADYKNNMDEMNQTINVLEEKNPWAFVGGDMAGSLSTLPAAGLKGAMGIGALSGLSRSEERTLSDALTGAAGGAVFHGLGVVGGKMISKGVKNFKNLASGTTKEAIGGIKRSALTNINRHLKKTGQTSKEFSDSLFKQRVKMVDGEEALFKVGQEFEDTLEKVKLAKGKVWGEMDDVLSEFADTKLSPEQIYAKIDNRVVAPLLKSDSSTKNALGQKIRNILDQDLKKVVKDSFEESAEKGGKRIIEREFGEPWNLRRLHALKKDIADDVYQTAKSVDPGVMTANQQKREVIKVLNDIIDDSIESSVDKSKHLDSIKAWKTLKKDYGNLAVADETLERHIESSGHGMLGNIKDMFAVRGVVVSGLSAGLGVAGLPALAIGAGLNRLTSSGAMPATMAVGMQRLSKLLVEKPTGEVASRLIRAASMPMLDFRRTLASEMGKMQLEGVVLPRDAQSAIKHKDSINAILEDSSPQVAAQFRSLVEKEDIEGINELMSKVASSGDLSRYVEQGVGWGGKVYSPEDKAMLRDQLLGNSDISLAQRLAHEKELMSNGTIPQVQPDEKPAYKHIPRRKDRHNY